MKKAMMFESYVLNSGLEDERCLHIGIQILYIYSQWHMVR